MISTMTQAIVHYAACRAFFSGYPGSPYPMPTVTIYGERFAARVDREQAAMRVCSVSVRVIDAAEFPYDGPDMFAVHDIATCSGCQ
jgi:hypothetical protein